MLRDLLERVVYTALATLVGAITAAQVLDVDAWWAAAAVAAVAVSDVVLVFAREQLQIVPAEPGSFLDAVERVVWTAVAAVLPAVPAAAIFDLSAWEAAAGVAFVAVSDVALVMLRHAIPAVPSPGSGLPGLPIVPPAHRRAA
jgi:hypothetical protein